MRRRGLTLLELMICFTLILLLVIFVLNIFPGSLVALHQSELRLEAQRQAEDVLYVARSAAFDAYALDSNLQLPPRGLNGGEFQPSLRCRAVDGQDPDITRELLVTVTWKERSARRSLTMASRISRAP